MSENGKNWIHLPVLQWLLPNLGSVVWCSVFLSGILIGPRMMNMDGDLGRHLTIGRDILTSMRIPIADRYSHTMLGSPLTPHEWLSQVLFAAADRLAGLDGVVLLTGVVLATAFWLIFRSALERSSSIGFATLFTIIGAGASSVHWLTRPHIFTILFTVLWVKVLEDIVRGKPKMWWKLPLLMVFWVNLHGAFLVGFVIWLLYGLGLLWDRAAYGTKVTLSSTNWKVYLLGGCSALAATVANPVGFRIWKTSVGFLSSRYLVAHTSEYLPPDFHQPATWLFLGMIVLSILLVGTVGKRQRMTELLLVGGWTAMSLYSLRNLPLYVVLAVPYLAKAAEEALNSLAWKNGIKQWTAWNNRWLALERNLKGFLLPALLVFTAWFALARGVNLDLDRTGNTFREDIFPVRASVWLAQHPPAGKMFNYFPWGGYLLYRLWDRQLVFIDGQTDFYGEEMTRKYEQIITMQDGWEGILDAYGVEWAILPAGDPLASALIARTGWVIIYRDETAWILIRSH